MRFFLDENFPKAAAGALADRGHETFDLRGTPKEGIPDAAIFAEAQARKALFLTTDRDFFNTIPHLFSSHFGVIVVALRQPSRAAILSKLSWALDRFAVTDLVNRVLLLRDRTWIAVPPFESGP